MQHSTSELFEENYIHWNNSNQLNLHILDAHKISVKRHQSRTNHRFPPFQPVAKALMSRTDTLRQLSRLFRRLLDDAYDIFARERALPRAHKRIAEALALFFRLAYRAP